MELRVLVCLLAVGSTTACCGGKQNPQKTTPAGFDVAPVTVRVSSFWQDLERACPTIKASNSPPSEFLKAYWRDVKAYCESSPRKSRSLLLAGNKDRDTILQGLLGKQVTLVVNLREPCETHKAQLSTLAKIPGPAAQLARAAEELCEHPDSVSVERLEKLRELLSAKMNIPGTQAIQAAFATSVSRVGAQSIGTSALSSSLAGIDVSSMVDVALQGLAQFLVKRAELELRTYAIDKLRKVAQCKSDTGVSRMLMNTCSFLGSDTGTLPAGFGPGLRAAFARDLTRLPRSLIREVKPAGGTDQLFARIALESAAILLDDPDPMQIVARIEALTRTGGSDSFTCQGKPNTRRACNDARATLYLAAILARIALTDGIPIRIDGQQLLARLQNELADDLKAMPDGTLKNALNDLTSSLNKWTHLMIDLRDDTDAVIASLKLARGALTSLPADASAEQRAKAVLDSARHALHAIDRSISIVQCMQANAEKMSPADCTTFRTFLPSTLADFLDAIRRKDITAAMTTGIALGRAALQKKKAEVYLSPNVTRLLSFGAELASAKDSKEAEAAIETIAMPPGGYKQKRKRSLISITSLVGASVGFERLSKVDDKVANVFSATGAVGLDFNKNIKDSKWTYGVFVTVIDVGALLNFRFASTDKTTAGEINDTANVGLVQVFAPGVGFRVGLGDSPLVAMAGLQVIPNGRTVARGQDTPDVMDDVVQDRSVVRGMFTLAVDVTLWSF